MYSKDFANAVRNLEDGGSFDFRWQNLDLTVSKVAFETYTLGNSAFTLLFDGYKITDDSWVDFYITGFPDGPIFRMDMSGAEFISCPDGCGLHTIFFELNDAVALSVLNGIAREFNQMPVPMEYCDVVAFSIKLDKENTAWFRDQFGWAVVTMMDMDQKTEGGNYVC